MGDHLRPVGAFEMQMQIPLIFRQPKAIPAGKTNDLFVSNYDFMPSLLGYLGLGDKMPARPKSPGRDFSPVLRGETIPWDNRVFYEMESVRAIRTQDWKYVARIPSGPYELYDMRVDPQERVNMFGQPGTEDIRQDLAKQLKEFFDQYADPQYDLWKGGRSKAKRLTD
jgi:arylsulfatase A-like enzyme